MYSRHLIAIQSQLHLEIGEIGSCSAMDDGLLKSGLLRGNHSRCSKSGSGLLEHHFDSALDIDVVVNSGSSSTIAVARSSVS